MQMTHKHDVYFSPYSTEAYNLVMQIADYCNKRGVWYKISESTLGIGIEYGGNVAYVIYADRKTENSSEIPNNSTISKMEQVDKDINVRSKDEPQTYVINPQEPTNDDKCFECDDFFTCGGQCNKIEDEPQTDLLVKTPRKSRESHEKNCETCRDKDAYDEWEGNCDECENGSMYTPQTDCPWK